MICYDFVFFCHDPSMLLEIETNSSSLSGVNDTHLGENEPMQMYDIVILRDFPKKE